MLSSAQESVAYDVIVDLRQQLLAARTTVAIGGSLMMGLDISIVH
jgi:hypothetical protein